MVKLVASRIAAIRLVWIVAVLMIPILILGFFLVRSMQEELSFNQKEQAGIEFLQALSPVLLDAADGKMQSSNYDFLLSDGKKFAAAANLDGQFEPLYRMLSNGPRDQAVILKRVHQLILVAGETTNIILDPNPETHYLGVASVQGMPDFVLRYKSLQNAAANALKNYDSKSLAQVATADGELRETTRLLWSQINAAKNVGRSSFEYIPFLADFDVMSKVNDRRTRDLLAGFGVEQSNAMAMLKGLDDNSDYMMDLHRGLWTKINKRFSDSKNTQVHVLAQKLSFIIITCVLAVLIGLGSAIAMFTSTLKRLDEISQARLDAETAQQAAEDMAGKLTVINDDMVGVNRELAHQMQMLKEAQDALVNKGRMEQLGQLTATIAHELRNPLGAVRTSAFLIERKIKGKQLGFEPQLERINNGVSRCDNIITQLLDFSRTKPLASRPSDLDFWLAKTIEEEAKQLPAAVAIECDLNLQEQLVPFDQGRLQRAVINLLTNASEAMVGKGDDPTKFETTQPLIRISTEIKDGHAVIRFKDSGPGIAPENIAKIREPLYTTKSFGTGLGLPAVDQIAAQHQGRLEINSKLGEGAEFVLFLPLHAEQESAA